MKKVCLFTTFYEADSGYSLIAVAETQIRMLLAHGYEPVVLVRDNFKSDNHLWQPERIDIRPVIPQPDTSASDIVPLLREHLSGVDVCITHDIALLPDYRNYNRAVKQYAQERDNLTWLHYLHSCPSGREEEPPGYLVYPNATDKPRVCQVYGLAGQEWRVIPNRASHAIDPLSVWNYDPLTRGIVERFNLLDADISAIYPVRLDRGKQPEKIIRLMAGVNRAGYTTRLLIVDWQSAGKRFQQYIDELAEFATSLNVELAFTSRLDDRCNQGVPRQIVTELMDLSTIYVHPSRSETYSLVVHEAMLRGKLVCLNHDFPVMRELFGESALYFDFGSDRFNRTYEPDEQSFWNDEARRLVAELKQNRALQAQIKARREWSPAAQFKEFESLLYLKPC